MDENMSMNPTEVSRMIDFLRGVGLDEKTINNCIQYIATGINPHTRESTPSKEQ